MGSGRESTRGTYRQTHRVESPNLLRCGIIPKRSPQGRMGVRVRILFLVLANLIAHRVAIGKGIAPLSTTGPRPPPPTPLTPQTRRAISEFNPSTMGDHLEIVAALGRKLSSHAEPPSVAFGVSVLRMLKNHLILPA